MIMKKLILTASLISVLTVSAFASNQKLNIASNHISLPHRLYSVTDLSKADNAKLTKSKNFFVATFEEAGVKKTSFYNLDKELVATTYAGSKNLLPAAGQKKLAKSYADYTIQEVIVYVGSEESLDPISSLLAGQSANKMYFVNLVSEKQNILVRINEAGSVFFFKNL
jgi:hypothetical protein